MIFKFKIVTSLLFALISVNALAQTSDDRTAMASTVPMQPQEIRPLLIGEKIPDAQLPDAFGKIFNFATATMNKPTILVFYRGGWCPYCNLQLAALEKIHMDLVNIGYQLISVSTDSPDNLKETISKRKITYTLLSDADLSLAKQFGIAYKAPIAYHDFLPKASGGKNMDNLLPVPSVFIINKKGEIQFEHIDPDFKKRISPELLKTLGKAYLKEQ